MDGVSVRAGGAAMRVSIHARYSSDLQRAASIEDQILVCKERLVREGWTLTATYSDRGISGASHLRPGYQAMLAAARRGEFDIVLAEALDRISRDQEHVASFFKHMTFAGIRVVTLAEGDIGELHVGLKGTMNALFLKDLADKTRRGLRGRVEQGRSGGGLCYGYQINRSAEGERGVREIDETEAAVIRRIFSDFAAGKSPRRIAAELNREGVRGPAGRPWGDTTIRGHALRGTGVLRNELYVGRLVWNRLRYSKNPTSGRRVSRRYQKQRKGGQGSRHEVLGLPPAPASPHGEGRLWRLRRADRIDREGLPRLLRCPAPGHLRQSCKRPAE
jgi:site-specific DNA recombinase